MGCVNSSVVGRKSSINPLTEGLRLPSPHLVRFFFPLIQHLILNMSCNSNIDEQRAARATVLPLSKSMVDLLGTLMTIIDRRRCSVTLLYSYLTHTYRRSYVGLCRRGRIRLGLFTDLSSHFDH